MSRLLALLALAPLLAGAAETTAPKPPSAFTVEAQRRVEAELPFADRADFERAERGLIRRPERLLIRNPDGSVAWQLGGYDFLLDGKPRDSINPSLQRQALLNLKYGLFEVAEGIYQVRGFDLANITFIRGDSGWIVVDTLTTPATARAAYELVSRELGERPIRTVIYSHAHADHFGGVRGLVEPQQVASGAVQIIAPAGFMEAAIKENVLAGNAMMRRATYQYGTQLPKGPQGQVDMAIGKGLARGPLSLLAPTRLIEGEGEDLVLDGVPFTFQNTPGTESPAEMNIWLPRQKALLMAENVVGTLHNLYTLRGAEVRDALGWSKYINQALHRFGRQAEVMFAVHNWPRWGNAEIVEVLEKQRDLYGFLHDQTLHLANQGVTIGQVHNRLRLPPSLDQEWYDRGYHGSVSHNARAVLNRYLGYYDGNPASLDPLSPEDSAGRYVEYMGGAEGALLPLLGEFRAVHQALAGGDLQAPGAAENQQARHAGAFHAVENGLAAGGVAGAEVGAAPAAVESADDHLVACHGAGHLGRVADVRLHYAEAVARRQLARVADQGGYRVAALQGFVEEIVADVAGGADQGDFHAAPSVREMPQSGVDQHHPPCARRDKPLRGGCTR